MHVVQSGGLALARVDEAFPGNAKPGSRWSEEPLLQAVDACADPSVPVSITLLFGHLPMATDEAAAIPRPVILDGQSDHPMQLMLCSRKRDSTRDFSWHHPAVDRDADSVERYEVRSKPGEFAPSLALAARPSLDLNTQDAGHPSSSGVLMRDSLRSGYEAVEGTTFSIFFLMC